VRRGTAAGEERVERVWCIVRKGHCDGEGGVLYRSVVVVVVLQCGGDWSIVDAELGIYCM